MIAFGAIAPWPTPSRLEQLRCTLQHQPSLKPVVEAIQELPLLWKELSKHDPSLHSIAGEAAADQLAQWMNGIDICEMVDNQSNVVRMPLTIVSQITQYIDYVSQLGSLSGHESTTKNVAAGGGIQGFCIGLLSALAVASGQTEYDVGKFATFSLRLAFCAGAYVDLDQHHNSGDLKSSTLAVRWKDPVTLDDIQNLLSRHQDVSIFNPP
jgi:hypothetical protein